MQTTTNYGLKKPDLADPPLSTDMNYNSDIIDAQLKLRALDTDNTRTTIAKTVTGAINELVTSSAAMAQGWVQSTDTWIYASVTTFTISGDVTAKYQKGDKYKLTANGVVLYGYIINVAFSAGTTTITVVGDTLTNYAYTLNYYSRAVKPFGFPDIFSWTPTLTWTTVTPTISSISAKFSLIGNTVHFRFCVQMTDGKGATNLAVSLPVAVKNLGCYTVFAGIQEVAASNTNPLPLNVNANGLNQIGFLTISTFTSGMSGFMVVSGEYEIA